METFLTIGMETLSPACWMLGKQEHTFPCRFCPAKSALSRKVGNKESSESICFESQGRAQGIYSTNDVT